MSALTKERVTFSIDVNLSSEKIKFVDVSSESYTFSLAPIENDSCNIWEGNPAHSDWIPVQRDQYYVIKAKPGDHFQYQKIAQIVLTDRTFRVKEVETPPNTLFMTVEQNEAAMRSIVQKIEQIASNSDRADNKQVLVFAEDPMYTNLPKAEKQRCVWKDYSFEMDVKNCTIKFVKEDHSSAVLSVYLGENNRTQAAPVLYIDLTENKIPQSEVPLHRDKFYTLYVRRGRNDHEVPVIMFKITSKTAIIRELPNTKPPVFLSYQKGYAPPK